jgi:DNA-binding beta-propeller fold protein YncE
MLQAVQRAEPQPGAGGRGEGAAAPRQPGRGGPGPTGTFPQQGGGGRGRGNTDAAQAAALAAWQAKYPPTAPVIIGGVEEIRLDEPVGEMYVADSSFGGRVMVFDLKTFAFKRGWGAYGKPLDQISTNPADRAYKPGGPMPKEFVGHLTLNFSNDGLVYAADRAANRIHVTTKQGKYVGKEFVIHPTTRGTTGGVAFSPDKEQRFLFVSDLRNNHIWFLNREDGKILGQMGTMGENGGQFFGLHMIAVDSKGVIYTGEVFNGERVQRFLPVN